MCALKRLKNKMTCGPDGVPCFFVKDCASVLLKPLSYIFNLSLKTHTFPEAWKKARITPVFKKGNASDIQNYRPVSILSPFAKVFEMAVYDRIFEQVRLMISPNQHGFFSNRSTISNLACFSQYVAVALDNRMQVDVIYTDFSKAFHRVNHTIFLNKCANMGFSKNLILFLESYLRDRVQYVDVRGHKSYSFKASSGAPQGSNLAPLIFSLFINDICSSISSNILLFADDVKLFRTIHGLSDCVQLQHDLSNIQRWCNCNNLPLNISKCFSMTFSNKANPINFDYVLDAESIVKTNTFKDLGVTFDPKLSFATHISNVCVDAIKLLGFILRNSNDFANLDTIKTLYYSYVRSKLEYGAAIWNPIYNKYNIQLENVQRRFVKFLAFKNDGIYPPRGVPQDALLKRFLIPSLFNRRNYILIQFLFKVCRSFIDCPTLLEQVNFHCPSRAVRVSYVFYLPTPTTNFLLKAPLFQAMNIFNTTCNDIDVNDLSPIHFTKALKAKFL
jgi:hypothetical protein